MANACPSLPPQPLLWTLAGCTEPSTRTGRVRLGDARDGTVAAATGLSYWQLLTAQHSDTGGKQHGGSPHGPFLLSPAKTYRLVLHLSKCALSYCSSISKTAPEPAAALSAALRKMGLPAEDIIAQYGVYGSQGAGLQPAAFLIGLALDCEGRRHVLGLGGMDMCIEAPGRKCTVLMLPPAPCLLWSSYRKSPLASWPPHSHELGLGDGGTVCVLGPLAAPCVCTYLLTAAPQARAGTG